MRAEERGRDDDPRVNEIVSNYVDRMNAGERITAELVLREEPLLAGEILDALQVFLDLDPKLEEEPLGTLGDYTLRRQIGRGGMGVVYEAWENSMDRRVALKVLPPGVAADERALQRFVREAKSAGQLTHPNVVGVYGMGLKDQTPYYAMEYVDGETLAHVLDKLKPAPAEVDTPFGKKDDARFFLNLAEAFADVADGLQHAHSKGIIHRDIKPSNLILGCEGRLRILDFGLARLEGQESLTISGDVVGTPLYMSPEQARRKKIPVDHRTDVYSLGATLYEMLTLEPPFRGKDNQDTLSRIIERDPVEPRKVNPRVPKDLETIVLKCLRKDAGDRYGTAEAMGQDLRRFVRGEIIEARPEGRWEWVARRIVRRRRAILTSVLLFISVACVAALLIVLSQRDIAERVVRYRNVVEDAILAIELAHAGPVEWEDAPPQVRSASDVDEWFADYQRELLEHAVANLKEAARNLPRRPEAYYHMARALRLLRRERDAEAELRAALRRDLDGALPGILEDPPADATGSATWGARWTRLRAAKRPIADRLRGYDDLALELRAGGEPYAGLELELRIEQGRAALQAGEHFRAVEIFGGLCQERPQAYTTALLLARAYYLLGQREQARRVGADALRLTLQTAEAALAFAMLHAHFGEQAWCKESIGAIPEYARKLEASFHLLSGYMSRDEALQLDSELASIREPSARVHDVRAYLSTYELQDPHRGAAIAEQGLQQFPRDGRLHDTLGWCLFYAGDFQQATAAFERVIALEPSRSRTHNGIGFAQYRLGNLERSEAAFMEALRIYPRLTFSYYGRGKVRWIRGDLVGAVDDFAQCLLLAPGHSAAARCLSQILGSGGEKLLEPYWSDLRRSFSRALSRQVKFPLLLGLLALCELHASPPDAAAALAHAEEGAADRGYRDPWLLDCLAQAQHAAGDTRAALRTLERAVEWVDVYPALGQRLAAYRQTPGAAVLTLNSLAEAAVGAVDPAFAGSDTLGAPRSLEQPADNDGGDDDTALVRHAKRLASSGRRDKALDLLENRVLPQSVSPGQWALWLRIASAEPPFPGTHCSSVRPWPTLPETRPNRPWPATFDGCSRRSRRLACFASTARARTTSMRWACAGAPTVSSAPARVWARGNPSTAPPRMFPMP